jgi:hypothetical protein
MGTGADEGNQTLFGWVEASGTINIPRLHKTGSGGGSRSHDLTLIKSLLYQLSYPAIICWRGYLNPDPRSICATAIVLSTGRCLVAGTGLEPVQRRYEPRGLPITQPRAIWYPFRKERELFDRSSRIKFPFRLVPSRCAADASCYLLRRSGSLSSGPGVLPVRRAPPKQGQGIEPQSPRF